MAVWQPSERYPDPRIEVIDPRFSRYVHFAAAVEKPAKAPAPAAS